jgi:hypothetical protein
VVRYVALVEKEIVMSVYNLYEDFEAFAIREGHLQSALQDAWQDYSQSGDISMSAFLKARRETHPHRYQTFQPDVGNVDHAALYSLAAQSAYLREHGENATREFLASQGLKLGQIKPTPKDEITDSTNPYSDKCKLSAAEKEKKISALVRGNAKLATSLAKSAGKTITGQPLMPVGAARMQR